MPNWPSIEATLHADATAHVSISGARHLITAADVDTARRKVLTKFAATAATLGRPVRVDVTDPDTRQWQLIVHPDGRVEEAPDPQRRRIPRAQAAQTTQTAAAAAPPQPAASSPEPFTAAGPRRWPRRPFVLAACAMMAIAVIAAAYFVTARPNTKPSTVRERQPVMPAIRLLEPAPGGKVGLYTTVRTETAGLAPSRAIWVLIDRGNPAGYFPQGPCVNDGPVLTICPHIQFGGRTDHGQKMRLCTVLGTPALERRFYDFVEHYKPGHPGLAIDLQHETHSPCIQVTRK